MISQRLERVWSSVPPLFTLSDPKSIPNCPKTFEEYDRRNRKSDPKICRGNLFFFYFFCVLKSKVEKQVIKQDFVFFCFKNCFQRIKSNRRLIF